MVKLDKSTIDIIDRSILKDNTLTLPQQLDRNDYVKVDKVLKSIGLKWDKKAKCHLADIGVDVSELISDIINTGGYVDHKKELGFFKTPDAVIDMMLPYTDLSTTTSVVLEPSAGDGAILNRIPNDCKVYFCEIDPGRFKICEEILGKRGDGYNGNFLEYFIPEDVNVILMNPPFSRQQDIDHVLHAIEGSKPGTCIVAVMSESTFCRENRKTQEFWKAVKGCHNFYIKDVPEGAFKKSGTGVKTRILAIEK